MPDIEHNKVKTVKATDMKVMIRKNTLVQALERKLGLGKGAIRNPDGSKPRSDKQLRSLIREYKDKRKRRK